MIENMADDLPASARRSDPSSLTPPDPASSAPQADAAAPPDTTFDAASGIDGLRIPSYDALLEQNLVTVREVADAVMWGAKAPNDQERQVFRRYYDLFVERLRREDPGFAHVEFESGSGVFLHGDVLQLLRSVGSRDMTPSRIDALIFKIDRLAASAREFTNGKQLRNCLSMAFDIAAWCFTVIEDLRTQGQDGSGRFDERLAFLEAEATRVQEYYERSAQRQAQVRYANGMLIGAAAIYAIALIVLVATAWIDVASDIRLLLIVIVAGCTGAAVSVMQRMTRATLKIDYTMGDTVRTLGVFRPLIGAIFALAVFFILRAHLIPHLVVPTDDTSIFFFSAVAFVTGFSERLAQDMLATTEKTLVAMEPEPEVLPPRGSSSQGSNTGST